MDPERVRAYLQVACAGLGFDIGEVWWTSNESGSSTVAAIEPQKSDSNLQETTAISSKTTQDKNNERKRFRFMQLYTSRSYADRRSKLLKPPGEKRTDGKSSNEHVLSPRLVDAISSSAEVVWANCQRREGLLGKSDVRLQTAVGMPVAMDADGNMCVVVMFSPNNVQSSDEAMEYLQYISRSAASSTIPCLLPVIDQKKQNAPGTGIDQAPQQQRAILCSHGEQSSYPSTEAPPQQCPSQRVSHTHQDLGEGVTARFVSFNDTAENASSAQSSKDLATDPTASVEIHTVHELSSAPMDCYGIPMLPSFAELGNTVGEEGSTSPTSHSSSEAFDEASYGVWSTIMNTPTTKVDDKADHSVSVPSYQPGPVARSNPAKGVSNGPCDESSNINPDDILVRSTTDLVSSSRESSSSTLSAMGKSCMPAKQWERLEEFASAFLGVSVFDAADVWIPGGGENLDTLSHAFSVSNTDKNESLNDFKSLSARSSVKIWSGAVGRAYGSGNPVWSANHDVIVDSGRAAGFDNARIKTALAVPIFSPGVVTPACVLCCYSLFRTDSVPFVLRFVQQALRLLWVGLEHVEPHESVGKEKWRDVAPADLGQMAADTAMQKAFLVKKRPHNDISSSQDKAPTLERRMSSTSITSDDGDHRARSSSLSLQLQLLNMPTEKRSVPIQASSLSALLNASVKRAPPARLSSDLSQGSLTGQPKTKRTHLSPPPPPEHEVFWTVQNHVQQAVRSVGDAIQGPEHQVHQNTPKNVPKHAQMTITPSPELSAVDQQIKHGVSSAFSAQHKPLSQPQPLSNPLKLPAQMPSHNYHMPATQHSAAPLHIAHVNHSNNSTASTAPGSIAQTPVPPHQPEPPPQYTRREDPAVARANIEAFNAMARMQGGGNTVATAPHMQSNIPAATEKWAGAAPNVGTANAPTAKAIPVASAPILIRDPAPAMPNGPASGAGAGCFMPETVPSTSTTFCLPTASGINVPPPIALNPSGKTCRIQGCNELVVARRPYCLKHSGNRLCEHEGCSKCAQGSTRFCIAHGGGRRCTFPGCDKGARDKFFCAAHGGGKRCRTEGCNKSAVGGSNLCTSHGGGRRCAVDGCEKSAQSSTKFCVKHGGGKKCSHIGCEKVARGRTLFCAAHGGGVRCKLEGCNRVAIGKLQLCRAHGGGTNSRMKSKKNQPPAPPTVQGSSPPHPMPPSVTPTGVTL